MTTIVVGAVNALLGRRRRAVRWQRSVSRLLIAAAIAFVLVWIIFLASNTSAGSAVSAPSEFLKSILNALTISGIYFIVASGFTLVFGLMRTVQMAHGSLFLLAGYFALEYQLDFLGVTGTPDRNIVGWGDWWLPLVIGVVIVSGLGLFIQQVFLRWNQGQDLRQALITIAISIVLGDQMIQHFGGVAEPITLTHQIHGYVNFAGIRYGIHQLFVIGMALGVGGGLWLLLKKTRTGMVIRAGVDDTPMVQALGINVQKVFAVAFVLGSALAGLGGVIAGSSVTTLAPGVDGQWLLHSLVVVIIGGMGSLGGAAAGSLLYGLATALAPVYLPTDYAYYSIIATFVILALVLAVRPYGLFGRPA